MEILRISKTAVCAVCLTGLIASSASMMTPAYADQSFAYADQPAAPITIKQMPARSSLKEVLEVKQESVFETFKEDLTTNTDLILSQTGSGRCTLAANAMILRRAAFIEGDSDWEAITEQSLGQMVWSGRGMPNSYTAFGRSVSFHALEGEAEDRKQGLIDLLEQHPEGLAVYDPGVPHALLLMCYDQDEDRFLCADPAAYNGGKILEPSETWNGTKRGSSQAVINNLRSYWCIDECIA